MESVSGERIQTAFRFSENLVGRLKRAAALRHCSVNAYVESVLERATALDWPSKPSDGGEGFDLYCCTSLPAQGEIDSNPRLAHILGL